MVDRKFMVSMQDLVDWGGKEYKMPNVFVNVKKECENDDPIFKKDRKK